MNISLRAGYKKIIAFALLFMVAGFLIQNSFKTWLAYSYANGSQPQGLKLASQVDPKNPDYYFLIAYYLMEYDFASSYDTVMEEYKKALLLSPLNHNYWYFVAEMMHMGGQTDKAIYALNEATTLSPGTVSLRWKSGMLASKLGDRDAVLDNLSAVIRTDPKRRNKAFSLLWQTVADENLIYDKISENALSQYFNYLTKTKRLNEAKRVYGRLNELGYDTSAIAPKYVGELIRQGDYDTAINIWAENFGQWDGVWNGGFDEEIKNDGFGWIMRWDEGVKTVRDTDSHTGKYAAAIMFDGKHNTEYRHLSQVIPVQQNSDYNLSMFIKADDLTTAEDLYWEVYCLDLNYSVIARSEKLYGTYDWKNVNVSFNTPMGCKAINLRLKRSKSEQINNLISGTIWVDDISLNKIR